MHKNMQKEIEKYQGRIFYFDEVTKQVIPAEWIKTLADYNHTYAELHHIIPYTDWETNTKDVRDKYINALILIPKVMHQHLENPEYKLPKEVFKKVYGIDPDKILLDVNSRIPRTDRLFTEDFVLKSLFDSDIADCFADVDLKNEQAKYLQSNFHTLAPCGRGQGEGLKKEVMNA